MLLLLQPVCKNPRIHRRPKSLIHLYRIVPSTFPLHVPFSPLSSSSRPLHSYKSTVLTFNVSQRRISMTSLSGIYRNCSFPAIVNINSTSRLSSSNGRINMNLSSPLSSSSYLLSICRFSSNYTNQQKKFDPYEILEIPRNATPKDIKLAYFKAAKKYHPDLNPNDPKAREKFQLVSQAYEVLSDPNRRANYDATGRYNPQYSNSYSETEQQVPFPTNIPAYMIICYSLL